MTEKTSAELEREAEFARSRMTETAESLQRKLSPGQIVDELSAYFRNSDGRVALDNLKTQVRDNPLPLALIGAGVAWLLLGNGTAGARRDSNRGTERDMAGGEPYGMSGAEIWEGASGIDAPDAGPSIAGYDNSSISEGTGNSLGDKVGSAYSSSKEAASSAANSLGEGLRRAGEAGRRATGQMRGAGTRAQSMVSDVLEREPLILGALGVAVGAAVGAMLPRTQAEAEYLAPYGKKVRENAKNAMDRGVEQTRSAVSAAMESLSSQEDADDPGQRLADTPSQRDQSSARAGSQADVSSEPRKGR
ncbi:DUF3618 domain-containing protein [Chelativorans sp. Marseille-P2723]|uniref:DUF3618 domain-containing protein n=1 Tax=Chelativorans sp. Marseille-P2723 TaxID=2709133 RepID=UPI00156ECF71|nr:DUF3618 domain-containing protein [Chelativorans sp. Marseille-P2723]